MFDNQMNDSVWAKIKLIGNDSLLIGCIYKSPNCTRDMFEKLTTQLKLIKDQRYSHLLIMGDFNFKEINWSNYTTNVSEYHMATQFLECVKDCYMYQHVEQPTRIRSGNEPSTLDLFLTNEEKYGRENKLHARTRSKRPLNSIM